MFQWSIDAAFGQGRDSGVPQVFGGKNQVDVSERRFENTFKVNVCDSSYNVSFVIRPKSSDMTNNYLLQVAKSRQKLPGLHQDQHHIQRCQNLPGRTALVDPAVRRCRRIETHTVMLGYKTNSVNVICYILQMFQQ